jgi:DNA-binding NtrC family response regulator
MKHILLVDDDPSARTTLAALLELEGHVVEEASSLVGSRAWLERSARADVALVDLNLVDGLGTALFSELRARCPGVRIVLMSGDGEPAISHDADARFVKGNDFSALLACMLPR